MTAAGLKSIFSSTRTHTSRRPKSKVLASITSFSITENVPDWQTEIGGLSEVKQQVEEIFGITQRYSLFFKGQKVN